MQEEIWLKIPNHEDYEVSNLGNVKRCGFFTTVKNGGVRYWPPRYQKLTLSKHGYVVSIGGKRKSVTKLVISLFNPNPRGHKQYYHIDGDITNNRASNLCWGLPDKAVFDKSRPNETEKDYLWRHYIVTKNGTIIRRCDNKELKPSLDNKGYKRIRLKNPPFSKNKDKRKSYKIHRLVAMYYLDDYDDKLQVNHKNGIKTDNRVENLEMVTNRQNVLHAWRVLDSTERRKSLLMRRDPKTKRFTKKVNRNNQ